MLLKYTYLLGEELMDKNPQIHESWKKKLDNALKADYMKDLSLFLKDEIKKKKTIFPPPPQIFSAFNLTTFDACQVVIIGQDPYHGVGEAHGLCFSVRPQVKIPPSLKNIFLEINRDLGLSIPNHGHLEFWAKQGVLLLNSVLTVEKDKPASHRGRGWEQFTDFVVRTLNQERENLVFMLWGRDAQKKGEIIDRKRHLVLESGHPSPFSVKLFANNHHFSKANKYLQQKGKDPINWSLPPLN